MEWIDYLAFGVALILLSGMVSWVWEWAYEKFLSIDKDLMELRLLEHKHENLADAHGILRKRHDRLVKLVVDLTNIYAGLYKACEAELNERRTTPQGNQPAEAADNGDGQGAA